MRTQPPRLIQQGTFAVRIILFLLAPTLLVYFGLSPAVVALIICIGVFVTWLIDLGVGGTVWIAAHKGTIAAQIGFLVVAGAYMFSRDEFSGYSLFTMLVLVVALSSDAITNSQRWKVLLPFAVVAAAIVNVVEAARPELWGAAAYPAIPFLAALARLVFPRTKNLIHTSLDYPPVRLEVLSLGMKRVAAVGIRRNSAVPV